MVRPERRTRSDLVAVALILVAVVVAGLVVWLRSDARATDSEPAQRSIQRAAEPAEVPAALREAWRAPSAATPQPVVAGPAAVSAEGGEVFGHDPATGAVRWRYARDLPLCTVGSEWNRAIAVYRKEANCSEVSTLQGSTGVRGPARNSDAEFGTRLLSDGTYVTATGQRVLGTWRSDLVRTQQYGIMPALKNANNNIRRPDCSYPSTAVGNGRIAVIEDCPTDVHKRLTVLKAHPQDNEQPEEVFSTVLGGSEATAVSVTGNRTAVFLRDTGQLVVYNNATGSVQSQFPMPADAPVPADGVEPVSPDKVWTVAVRPDVPQRERTARALAAALSRFDPRITEQSVLAGLTAATPEQPYRVSTLNDEQYEQVEDKVRGIGGASVSGMRYWHTGTGTVALDSATLEPLWTVPDTLGPGALFGGKLLVPVRDGLAVVDRNTGARERTIPIDRQGWQGPVRVDSVGSTLLEQRGPALVALR